MGLSGSGWRPTALTTPKVTEFCRPSGLPMAMTNCPTRALWPMPRASVGSLAASILSRARSLSLCTPRSLASRMWRLPAGVLSGESSGQCQSHADALGSLDHVGVGDDVAVRVHDHA